MAFVTSPRLTSDGLNDLRSLTYVAGIIITGVADFLEPLTFSQNKQTNNTPPPMLRDSTGTIGVFLVLNEYHLWPSGTESHF